MKIKKKPRRKCIFSHNYNIMDYLAQPSKEEPSPKALTPPASTPEVEKLNFILNDIKDNINKQSDTPNSVLNHVDSITIQK